VVIFGDFLKLKKKQGNFGKIFFFGKLFSQNGKNLSQK
jgi:hypothetical protein